MSNRGSPATQAPQPPKPHPAMRNGTATRKQTSSYGSLTTGRSKENLLSSPAYSSSISSPTSARKYLSDHFLLTTNQDPEHSSLSHALLHLTFTATGITTPTADAIRSIAILFDSLAPTPLQERLCPPTPAEHSDAPQNPSTGTLERQITLLGTYVQALREVTSLNTSSASALTRIVDEAKDDLHNAAQHLSSSAEELIDAAKSPPPQHPFPPHQAFTYADAARQKLLTIATEKCLAQTKTVRISPPPNDPTASFKDLNENILLEKANMTLVLVRESDPTVPTEAEFISARKTTHGQVLYEVDSPETADWLRSPEGSKAFTAKFRSDVMLAVKPFPTLVELVPIRLDIDNPSTLREVERKNSLPAGSIKSARWIKPIERRSPLQKRAHMTVDFLKPNSANLAIKNGLVILGPRCSVRKLLPEPIRCMKCQSFEGSHFARNCTSLKDMCGTCAGNHRTKECEISSPEQRFCANCQETGHAAWDRDCPIYLSKARKYQSHIADARYRFYPERDDPTTWALDCDDDQLEDHEYYTGNNQDERWQTTEQPRKPRPFPMGPPDKQHAQRTQDHPHPPNDRPPPPPPHE